MQNLGLLLSVVLVGACACAADDSYEVGAMSGERRIPRRCVEKSVTRVSCEAAGADALLPHPDDCQLFYQCVGALAVCRQCPAALHFNPDKHVCDYPTRAGCPLRSV